MTEGNSVCSCASMVKKLKDEQDDLRSLLTTALESLAELHRRFEQRYKIKEKDCTECGTKFTPTRGGQKFCSAKCRHHRTDYKRVGKTFVWEKPE